MDLPRPEHPRPHCVRESWLNLNGRWDFADDPGDEGEELGWVSAPLAESITVPFCRESSLSGLNGGQGRRGRMIAVWYRRRVMIPAAWAGQRVLLHCGAIDHECTVWADGERVGDHMGGHTSFTLDLSVHARAGSELAITIRARDPWWLPRPRGKQAAEVLPSGCLYHRVTGIWQTVWLEAVPQRSLQRPRLTPLLDAGAFLLEQGVAGSAAGLSLRATLGDAAGVVTVVTQAAGLDFSNTLLLPIPAERQRRWCPTDPHLYDLRIELLDADGRCLDAISSYAGLRSVAIDGRRVLLNGQPLFQKLVLDQGWYPDGLLTAPSDAALEQDIRLAQELGFNGARLHQKIFEERYLYHADRLGWLCWGELPDWTGGVRVDTSQQHTTLRWVIEWQEALARDYSHPCIVGWCPLNEQAFDTECQRQSYRELASALYHATKLADRSRPVLDASGWWHVLPESDLYDAHDYEPDPAKLAATWDAFRPGQQPPLNYDPTKGRNLPWGGQPFFISEFGGIKWAPGRPEAGWGYGDAPRDETEFFTRLSGQCRALLSNPDHFGYCYTQLTDVFQEVNGCLSFDRTPKFPAECWRAAQSHRAACESG